MWAYFHLGLFPSSSSISFTHPVPRPGLKFPFVTWESLLGRGARCSIPSHPLSQGRVWADGTFWAEGLSHPGAAVTPGPAPCAGSKDPKLSKNQALRGDLSCSWQTKDNPQLQALTSPSAAHSSAHLRL